MKFELVPILEKIAELYKQPAGKERFNAYLTLLTGNTRNDLELPISGFNPMAKQDTIGKLKQLIESDTERIAAEEIARINQGLAHINTEPIIKVFINLADDRHGGWTNRYTSDYDSKFRINALLQRNFCTPVFWTSENYSTEKIRRRVSEYLFRTIYRLNHCAPATLSEHIRQEAFVQFSNPGTPLPDKFDAAAAEAFLHANGDSEDYNLIFNFMYGDLAAANLAFPVFDIHDKMLGYDYANYLSKQMKDKFVLQ